MNGNKDKEAVLKSNIEALLSRKSIQPPSAHAVAQDTDRVADMERENQRLQRLLGEMILKNQQLRAALAGRGLNAGNAAEAL